MQNLRSLCIVFLIAFIPQLVFSQPWMKQALTSEKQENHKKNFFDVQKKFENYWKDKNPSVEEEENADEGGYQQYKRWEWFMKQRTYPSGEFFSPDILFREYKRYTDLHPKSNARSASSNWSFIGPDVVPVNEGGAGRVNVIRFDPSNPQHMFLGSAAGGLWESVNSGQTWTSVTDLLPALSIADIAINPRNPDTMYVATGDGYGYEYNGDFWGGTYTAGVLISTDRGQTWNATGLSYSQAQTDIIQRLIIHPVHPEIMLAGTRNGIFRTIDGGASWNLVASGHYMDLEFNTANPDIVYATNDADLYRSSNAGQSWSQFYQLSCSGRISIVTTAANANVIYALCESGTLYRSSDGGISFTQPGVPGVSLYGYYDCVLAASQVDENTVYCGGVTIVKSTDGGVNWQAASSNAGGANYVHADNHFIDFYPGSNTRVFSGNDGGIFRTDDGGNNWTDLSNTLGIKQYYRLGQSSVDPYLIYAGAQDNGTDRLQNSSWSKVYGGDGMECLVDYTNDNNVYVSAQNGYIQKSTDGGNTFNYISPSSGAWVTPFIIDPVDPQTLYAGFYDVQKTVNGGSSWNSISGSIIFNGEVQSMAIAPSNNNVLYAASLGTIFRTDDGGNNWTDITPGLPVLNAGITYIAVSNRDPHHVWVTFTGYSNGEKVYSSTDGGLNWTNISGTLPNIPVNCVVYQNLSNDIVYIGTDIGVFYRDSAATDWSAYNSGLPNVIVDELEIQYASAKIRAATYGRGIWEADIIGAIPISLDAGVFQIVSPALSSCDFVAVPEFILKNYGSDTLFNVLVHYQFDSGSPQSLLWVGVVPGGNTVHVVLPSSTLSAGNHTLTISTSDPNGGVDQQAFNDARVMHFDIKYSNESVPIVEDFQSLSLPPFKWKVVDSGSLLKVDSSVGGFGLSSGSIYANCYSIGSNSIGQLISPGLDFSNSLAPATFSFNVAYSNYSTFNHDSLLVSVSTDCEQTYTRIYAKGDDSLATAPVTTSSFVPQPNQWRRDSVDVSSWLGNSNVIFKIEFKSGYGNNIYLDDINIMANSIGVNEVEKNNPIRLYPNPFEENFQLSMITSSSDAYRIEITDLTGRILMIQPIAATGGFSNTSIHTTSFAHGMYYYRILKNNRVLQSGKLVKA